jgi:hypothetical protein
MYEVITYSRESDYDAKEDVKTLTAARKIARNYLRNGWDGAVIYNLDTLQIREAIGYTPGLKIGG